MSASRMSFAAVAAASFALLACTDNVGTNPTTSTGVSLASGSGGGGGGGGGGSVPSPSPTPAPTPAPPPAPVGPPAPPAGCWPMTLWSAAGYAPRGINGAAIWHHVTIKNCSTSTVTYSATVADSLAVPASRSWALRGLGVNLAPGDSVQWIFDHEPTQYGSTYISRLSLVDYSTGAPVYSCEATALTPKARGSGGGAASSDGFCYR